MQDEDIKYKKFYLETGIINQIRKFEEETGVDVTKIEILNNVYEETNGRTHNVNNILINIKPKIEKNFKEK